MKLKQGRIPHRKVKIDGIEFDSQAEAERYRELKLLQRAGRIKGLTCHPHYELIPTQRIAGRETLRKHSYTADFAYDDAQGRLHVEDVKSRRTRAERDYIINRKLMWMLHGIYVEEVLR